METVAAGTGKRSDTRGGINYKVNSGEEEKKKKAPICRRALLKMAGV